MPGGEDDQPQLLVKWKGSPAIGWHRYLIGLGLPGETIPGTTLDVAAHVVPIVEALPAILFLSSDEARKDWRRKVVIKASSDVPVGFDWEWSDTRFAQAVSVTRDRDAPANLVLRCASEDALSTVMGQTADLIIRSREEADCRVRLYLGDNSWR